MQKPAQIEARLAFACWTFGDIGAKVKDNFACRVIACPSSPCFFAPHCVNSSRLIDIARGRIHQITILLSPQRTIESVGMSRAHCKRRNDVPSWARMGRMYRDFGWSDENAGTASYLYRPLREMLRHDKQKRILDMGCGNGEIASLLIDEGFDVFGLDGSESGIELANRRHPGRFFVHDVGDDALPEALRDKPFDIVISTEVIEHLYAPNVYMQLVQKTLKSSRGEIILSTPYHGYAKNLALALTNKMDDHFQALWDGGHIKFFSRKTLTRLLQDYGFEVTEFRGVGRIRYLWKSMLVRARLRAM